MRTHTLLRTSSLAAALMLGVGLAQAAPRPSVADAQSRYQHERAACLNGQSSEGQATCLKEAAAARDAARRGALEATQRPDYKANALERCRVFNGEDAAACRARVLGEGTTSGSVASGGILRELVTIEPVAAQ